MPTYIRPAKVVVTEGGGGGGGLAVLLAVIAVIAVLIRKPVEHAADDMLRVVVDALEIAAITVASVAGLAILAALAYGARRAYRWQARNRQAIARHTPAIQHVSCTISAPQPAAIEPPHHLITGQKPAGYTTADLRARPGVSRPATTKED